MNKSHQELEPDLTCLIKSLSKDLGKCRSTKIHRGHMISEDPKVKGVRVRAEDNKYTYTIKTFAKSSQETGYYLENNKNLSREEFTQLNRKAIKKIRKIRYYYILEYSLRADIYIYEDNLRCLIVIEIEFPSITDYKFFKTPD